jgi:hypothetical protein
MMQSAEEPTLQVSARFSPKRVPKITCPFVDVTEKHTATAVWPHCRKSVWIMRERAPVKPKTIVRKVKPARMDSVQTRPSLAVRVRATHVPQPSGVILVEQPACVDRQTSLVHARRDQQRVQTNLPRFAAVMETPTIMHAKRIEQA